MIIITKYPCVYRYTFNCVNPDYRSFLCKKIYCKFYKSYNWAGRSAASKHRPACGLTGLLMSQHGGLTGSTGLTVVHLVLWPWKLYHRPGNQSVFNVVDEGDSFGQSPLHLSRWLLGVAMMVNIYVIASR